MTSTYDQYDPERTRVPDPENPDTEPADTEQRDDGDDDTPE